MNQTCVIETLISVGKEEASSHSLRSVGAGTDIVGLGDRRRRKTSAKEDACGSKNKSQIFFWLNVLFKYLLSQLEPQTDLCKAE